jgi:transposase
MARPSRYPEEFRREAVQLALAADASWASVARRLGVNETTLRNWVHAHQAEEARAADPLKVSPSEFEELRRLRAENAELKVEKEILREAAAYFARETIRSAASGSSPSTEAPGASSGSAGSSASPGQGSTRGRTVPFPKGARRTKR